MVLHCTVLSCVLYDLTFLYISDKTLPPLVSALEDWQDPETEGSDNMNMNDDTSRGALLKEQIARPLRQCVDDLEGLKQLVEEVVDLEEREECGRVVVRAKHDPELSELKEEWDTVVEEANQFFEDTQSNWGEGAAKMKMDHDRVRGWILRFPSIKMENLINKKKKQGFRILDSLKSGIRFTHETLESLNTRHDECEESYVEKSREVVIQAMGVAASYAPVLEQASTLLAKLDVLLGFAHLAAEAPTPYCKPSMVGMEDGGKDGATIEIKQARHPCLEMMEEVQFIPNEYSMARGKSHCQLITGPNMGGKSTYIRQLGTICVMAQMGSWVPADSANLCVLDSVLARVGAGDMQQQGVSTFMAEMLEASSILQTATKNSLVIVDELGRGTSTYDGFGLAWAICEQLAIKKHCFTLFATHFHELTALGDQGSAAGGHANGVSSTNGVINKHVRAVTQSGQLTMLYEVHPGPSLRSFGVHVAELAKFPQRVVEHARRRAGELEHYDYSLRANKNKNTDENENENKRGNSKTAAATETGIERGTGTGEGPESKRSKTEVGVGAGAQQSVRDFLKAFANLPLSGLGAAEVNVLVLWYW